MRRARCARKCWGGSDKGCGGARGRVLGLGRGSGSRRIASLSLVRGILSSLLVGGWGRARRDGDAERIADLLVVLQRVELAWLLVVHVAVLLKHAADGYGVRRIVARVGIAVQVEIVAEPLSHKWDQRLRASGHSVGVAAHAA